MVRVRLRVEAALEGRSGAEAARQLGMKVATVFVARSKVQKMLAEEVHKLDAPAGSAPGGAMTPCPAADVLGRLLAGDLAGADAADVEGCPACQDRLAALAGGSTVPVLHQARPGVSVEERALSRLAARVPPPTPAPTGPWAPPSPGHVFHAAQLWTSGNASPTFWNGLLTVPLCATEGLRRARAWSGRSLRGLRGSPACGGRHAACPAPAPRQNGVRMAHLRRLRLRADDAKAPERFEGTAEEPERPARDTGRQRIVKDDRRPGQAGRDDDVNPGVPNGVSLSLRRGQVEDRPVDVGQRQPSSGEDAPQALHVVS
jgi:hypothetical protein